VLVEDGRLPEGSRLAPDFSILHSDRQKPYPLWGLTMLILENDRPEIETNRTPVPAERVRLGQVGCDALYYHDDEAAEMGLEPWREVHDVNLDLKNGKVVVYFLSGSVSVRPDHLLFAEGVAEYINDQGDPTPARPMVKSPRLNSHRQFIEWYDSVGGCPLRFPQGDPKRYPCVAIMCRWSIPATTDEPGTFCQEMDYVYWGDV